ncbi:MAG: CvpA family protein [Bacteroidetes bacterium]|nr:MAG: CvpA family protein [Bacteroidota bacterium]
MIIDGVCLVLALYGFWVGYSRGIIKTVLTFLSFLFGLMAAAKFSPTVSTMLQEYFPDTSSALMFFVALILTFMATLFLFRMLANGLENMLEAVNINFINQFMGGVVGMLFFVFIYSALVSFADNSRLIDDHTKKDSLTYPMLEPLPELAWSLGKTIWPTIQEFWEYALDVMDQIDSQVERHEDDKFFDLDEEQDDSRDNRQSRERPRRFY